MKLEERLIEVICKKCRLGKDAMEECIETKTCCPNFHDKMEILNVLIKSYETIRGMEQYYEHDFRIDEWLSPVIEKITEMNIEEVLNENQKFHIKTLW